MYNLRSTKQNTVHLPIEIQLAGDTQFIDSVLHTNSHNSDFPENMSASDTSASDLNCSDLMQNSLMVFQMPKIVSVDLVLLNPTKICLLRVLIRINRRL